MCLRGLAKMVGNQLGEAAHEDLHSRRVWLLLNEQLDTLIELFCEWFYGGTTKPPQLLLLFYKEKDFHTRKDKVNTREKLLKAV